MGDDEAPAPDWTNEYAAWCAEQDDEDEINRPLNEAADDHES